MKYIVGFLFVLILWSITPIGISNAYLHTNLYDTITVKQGDDVWNIAKVYASDTEDIRALISAIKELNRLDHSAHIFPGQKLKIPINKEAPK
ncbi:LysM peptidoglycan-binding domain-containing protein [Anaerosinus massiliensis]|uniref:LysM peptidoglycan-binding domain-containing protein n=1 Tax=Massilibacillus massiliensis TaxID=1806837 RepID=UPI000DA6109A|nr:LysM peptidoglycan-binding domain-containing protein [Massilibacillus massiliensis]